MKQVWLILIIIKSQINNAINKYPKKALKGSVLRSGDMSCRASNCEAPQSSVLPTTAFWLTLGHLKNNIVIRLLYFLLSIYKLRNNRAILGYKIVRIMFPFGAFLFQQRIQLSEAKTAAFIVHGAHPTRAQAAVSGQVNVYITFLMVAQYWGSILWSRPSICFSFSHTASTFIEFSDTTAPEAGPDP